MKEEKNLSSNRASEVGLKK